MNSQSDGRDSDMSLYVGVSAAISMLILVSRVTVVNQLALDSFDQ